MDNNEREIELVKQIEELRRKTVEAKKSFIEKEYIINQAIKVKDVQYDVQYCSLPDINKIILENGFILNYDGSFDVSISSFYTRVHLSDEAKSIEKEINEQIELYFKALYLLNHRDNVKKEASRIFDKYAEEIYPLEKELYSLTEELHKLRKNIGEEKLRKIREFYKYELLSAGKINVVNSVPISNRSSSNAFYFTTDKKGNLIINIVRDCTLEKIKKIKIKDEYIRRIHNQIFREVGKIRWNGTAKYEKRFNVLSEEEYVTMRTKGYDAIDWIECTYEEYRKLM